MLKNTFLHIVCRRGCRGLRLCLLQFASRWFLFLDFGGFGVAAGRVLEEVEDRQGLGCKINLQGTPTERKTLAKKNWGWNQWELDD